MEIFLLLIHILISIVLVLVILAQTSKGNGLDSNLGGAASNVFGSSASDMLKKWTQIVGGLFLVSCVVLALYIKSGKSFETILPEKDSNKAVETTTTTTEEINPEQSDIQEVQAIEVNEAAKATETTSDTQTEPTDK